MGTGWGGGLRTHFKDLPRARGPEGFHFALNVLVRPTLFATAGPFVFPFSIHLDRVMLYKVSKNGTSPPR